MIARVEDNIIITGKVSGEREQQIMQIAAEVEKSTAGSLRTLFQNIPVQDKLDTILTGNIVSYGGNERDLFVELDNGKRLAPGVKLQNGYVIDSIRTDGIDLSSQGEQIHIPLSI